MLIDTHCHLDASEFDADRCDVIADAAARGVRAIVIPAIARFNFDTVRDLAHQCEGGAYALGIHPIFVRHAQEDDLDVLRDAIIAALPDPRFVAIGEIGLDFFIPEIAQGVERDKQERFYAAQLKLAAEFDLPVLLHVRRSQDILLKYLRRIPVRGGIGHAFNGSAQQARAFIDLGFALGVGGAMTWTRALNIRRLCTDFDLGHYVLETDAPDIPPAWLPDDDRRNTPGQVHGVAQALAQLRGIPVDDVIKVTGANALRVLPKLAGIKLS
ncbi:TatD family hydrolase [Pigmentiphaga litoralis]|uniref:TatD family hydrolase n=1 Tax=Pigmentiphaga litoralis TaxID=516702 RepID=UPI003B42BA72